jgi:hypothetical protein
MLERKEDMKRRGIPTPDIADAFALTFACPVHALGRGGRGRRRLGGKRAMRDNGVLGLGEVQIFDYLGWER